VTSIDRTMTEAMNRGLQESELKADYADLLAERDAMQQAATVASRQRAELLAALRAIVCMPGDPRAVVTNPPMAALIAGHELVRRLEP